MPPNTTHDVHHPALPPHATAKRLDRLTQLERLSNWLDSSMRIPGTQFRIGWDSLIGFVPGVGDAITTAMSAWIVWKAHELGVSRWTLGKMLFNVAVDASVGSIPIVGDLFDVAFKANRKNVRLLRRAMAEGSGSVRTTTFARHAKATPLGS